MKKGGKRLIAIPSALAYGEKVKDTNSKIILKWESTLETQGSRVLCKHNLSVAVHEQSLYSLHQHVCTFMYMYARAKRKRK